MDVHAEQRTPDPGPAQAGTGPPAGPPAPRRMGRRRKILVWVSVSAAFVLVVGMVCGWLLLRRLDHNIRTADGGTVPSDIAGTQNILLIGSDNRSGSDAKYGTANGARSDTTILFHTSADRRGATVISIPRDSMVQIPDCTRSDGTVVPADYGMFNSAFDEGGIACTVKTVEELTGINITHFIVLDFTGFAATVDALGGVKVCTTQRLVDQDSELDIPAGVSKLTGDQALAFVRVRHIGDGSDLERIVRQQYFLHGFSAQIRTSGLMTDPLRLYRVLDDATKSIVTDPSLGSLTSLYALTESLDKIPAAEVEYETVPVQPDSQDPDRVVWQEPDATEMWDALSDEQPTHAPSAAPTAGASAGADADGGAAGSGDGTGTAYDNSGNGFGSAVTSGGAAAATAGGAAVVPSLPIAVRPAAGQPSPVQPDTDAQAPAPVRASLTHTNATSGTDPQGMYTCPVG
ncbi:MAG TPA: LCP family protein [Actinocrinis sp.]|nr:LCP family protein [Actinocrinis sp.]